MGRSLEKMGWGERRCWSWISPAADRQWERERLDCLSGCNPVTHQHPTPGPTQGTRFYCFPRALAGRQYANPPTEDRRGGSLQLGSALNFPLALASGCQPDRVGSALLCCTSPQRCDERNPVGDNGAGIQ